VFNIGGRRFRSTRQGPSLLVRNIQDATR